MRKVFVGLLVTMLVVCAGIFGGLNGQSKDDPRNTKDPVVCIPPGDLPIA